MADEPEEEQPEETTKPVKSSIISWAEVYRVDKCNDCGKSDCPHCVRTFLKYLGRQGTRPKKSGGN